MTQQPLLTLTHEAAADAIVRELRPVIADNGGDLDTLFVAARQSIRSVKLGSRPPCDLYQPEPLLLALLGLLIRDGHDRDALASARDARHALWAIGRALDEYRQAKP